MKVSKANPFVLGTQWYWVEEDGYTAHGPYPTESKALYTLLRYMSPPWYTRCWNSFKEIWRDSRG
jgi:hypothetical protein